MDNGTPIVKDDPPGSVQVNLKNAPAVQAAALATISNCLMHLTGWLTEGGLAELLSGYARTQAVKEILGGLAAHDGRQALDARVLNQNALEIVHQVEAVFKKYQASLQNTEEKDPNLHNAETDYQERKEKYGL